VRRSNLYHIAKVLLKRFEGNPDLENAKVNFDRAQEVEERLRISIGKTLRSGIRLCASKFNIARRILQYQAPTVGTYVGIGPAATVGLLNRPQRKSLSRTESGILKVNKVNPAIVTSTDERFVVSKDKGVE
jgi:hypothetical protein